MDLISVPQRVVTDGALRLLKLHGQTLKLSSRGEWFRHIFHTAHSDVDPESSDTSVAPESQRLEEILENGRMVPVKVGLGRVEQVEVELTWCSVLVGRELGPSGTAEKAFPVVWRLRLVRSEA